MDASSGGEDLRNQPDLETQDVEFILRKHFAIEGVAKQLPSERDQNFEIVAANERYVFKVANPDTSDAVLELENHAIRLAYAISEFNSAQLFKSTDSQTTVSLNSRNGERLRIRLLGYVPGTPLAKVDEVSPDTLAELGATIARLDDALSALNQNYAAKRDLKWDLINGSEIVGKALNSMDDGPRQRLLSIARDRYLAVQARVKELPESVIHNDVNDYNVLIDEQNEFAKIGIIDFGDMVYSKTIHNLAIGLAYVILDKDDPLSVACDVVRGYHGVRKIAEAELSVLFELMTMRLAQSVSIAAEQKRIQPENEYLSVTEMPAWNMLEKLALIEPAEARIRFSDVCHQAPSLAEVVQVSPAGGLNASQIKTIRDKKLGPSLSLSYQKPLHIVRGKGQYLYDSSDLTFLDCVNNVCHVGHCHPKVTSAAMDQIQRLNTNTRYLNENIARLAVKLTATLPEPLEVCFFVNSGSEANDLALRMAQTYTGAKDMFVLDHAYHGHTSSLIDVSPYKFNSQGGQGKPEHVHVLPSPDGYRGKYKYEEAEYGSLYSKDAIEAVKEFARERGQPANFIAESLLGCGGQVDLPTGYLAPIYQTIRHYGGVCIADEVQVGFGRVGTHYWGFQRQNVVPDIVTMGKPFGNGHPLAALVTTREIADAFNNGLEYFNTFGGNPVSCAVGLAVMEVIEKEELQAHAHELGQWILGEWGKLYEEFSCIGDVRGTGLFLGMELVKSRETREPHRELAKLIVNSMRDHCILLSTDGPYDNVIKFKPPMVFSKADAERLVLTLQSVMNRLSG